MVFGSDPPAFQLVEFFAKSCPHCVHMAPVWATAKHVGEQQFHDVAFDQKECYSDNWAPGKDIEFCQAKGIGAFPTIELYKTATGEHWTAPPLAGNGVDAKASSLLKFVKEHVGQDNDIKTAAIGGVESLVMCGGPDGRYANFL